MANIATNPNRKSLDKFYYAPNNDAIILYIITATEGQDLNRLKGADIYELMNYVVYMENRLDEEESAMTFVEWRKADPELIMAGKI